MKPVIGVETSLNYRENLFQVHNFYVEAVAEAGGVPLLIAPQQDGGYASEIIGRLDGILITGGGDVDPRCFNEENTGLSKGMSRERDITETQLIKAAVGLDMPILGICRGCQMINVVLGGDLYQDISLKQGTSNHNQDGDIPGWYPYHDIRIEQESIMYGIFGKKTIGVNSYHHQAVKNPAKGLRVTASSEDDIIEAIEGTENSFILGVQFHPEKMFHNDRSFLAVFEALINAAKIKEAI